MSIAVNLIRWMCALTCTSAAAACAYAAQVAAAVWLGESYGASSPGASAYVGLASFALAAAAFLCGVAVLGAPAAFIMNRRGWTRLSHVAVVGGALATLIGGGLLTASLGWAGLALTLALPIAGAVGGVTFHALTQRRP